MKTPQIRTVAANILIFMCFLYGGVSAQPAGLVGILPKKITILTNNLDSLVRSYTKKGFNPLIGEREPTGIFNDHIYLESGLEIELAAPSVGDHYGWEADFVHDYGARMSALNFETNDPDSLYNLLVRNGIPCVVVGRSADSLGAVESFALDSCHPLDIIFERTHRMPKKDMLAEHKNGVYRLDWVLLSCGDRMKEIMTQVFELSEAYKGHQGCCDFWHMGTGNDYTLARFEPIPLTVGDHPYWFSVEVNNFYWAY